MRQKFPDTGFRQGYGATESTACISCHPLTHYDYKYAHTGGMLCANTSAKVLDLNDPNKMLGPNQTGEICARDLCTAAHKPVCEKAVYVSRRARASRARFEQTQRFPT